MVFSDPTSDHCCGQSKATTSCFPRPPLHYPGSQTAVDVQIVQEQQPGQQVKEITPLHTENAVMRRHMVWDRELL